MDSASFFEKNTFASHKNLQRSLWELSALKLSSLAWQLGVLGNSLAGLQRHHGNPVFMACLTFPLDYTLGLVIYLIMLQKDFIFHVIHVLLCLISFPGKSWGEFRCIPGSSSCGQESNSTRSLRRE